MFSFWSSNIRGLSGNLDFLKSKLSSLSESKSPSVILLCETFLSTNVPDTAINIENYSVLRRDRDSFGGGLIIYYKNITLTRLPKLENIVDETLWFRFNHCGTRFTCCLGYRPPSSGFQILENLSSSSQHININNNNVTVLFGDLNLTHLNLT